MHHLLILNLLLKFVLIKIILGIKVVLIIIYHFIIIQYYAFFNAIPSFIFLFKLKDFLYNLILLKIVKLFGFFFVYLKEKKKKINYINIKFLLL
jgi:hypothetical protein